MFEQLVNDAATRLGLPTSSVSAVLRQVLLILTNPQTGGAEGFVDRFRRAGLGDVLTSWFGGKQGPAVTASHLESALGANTLDSIAKSTGLTRGVATSALAFLLPKVLSRLTPRGTLPPVGDLRSQLSSYLTGPAGALRDQSARKSGISTWLPLALIALLAVAIGALWMRAPAGTIDPQLSISNRDGKITYSGLVRDESTRTAIANALSAVFGAANISGDVRVDPNAKAAAWRGRLAGIVQLLKVPGVDFSLSGDVVSLGGWLSAADRQVLTDRIRSLLGAETTVAALGDVAIDAVRAANARAMSALAAFGSSMVTTDAIVQAMNLSIVNFASGSAAIPVDSRDVIHQSAEALKKAPAGSVIEVGGHTDNTGDAAANRTLSQQRAEAVRAALVADGVPAKTLTTKGYGDSSPRASNETEFGRFQNRRIEYSVVAGSRP